MQYGLIDEARYATIAGPVPFLEWAESVPRPPLPQLDANLAHVALVYFPVAECSSICHPGQLTSAKRAALRLVIC